MLYATLTVFDASYIYDVHAAAVLMSLKWVPLLALLTFLVLSADKHYALRPTGALPPLVIALLFVGIVATVMGDYRQRGLIVVAGLIASLATALFLAKRIERCSAEDQFFDIVANTGRAVVLISFITAILGISLGRGDRYSGWTDNPNSLGLLLAPIIVILAARVLERRKGWLWWDFLFMAVALYVLFLTGSRSSIGWVALSFIGFVLCRAGNGILVAGVFCAAMLIVPLDATFSDVLVEFSKAVGRHVAAAQIDYIFSGRTEVWAIALEKFSANWLGYGIGSSGPMLASLSWRFVENQGLHFHSSYLTALVEAGAIGFILLVAIVVLALSSGFRSVQRQRRSSGCRWPNVALPWALLFGAAFHAATESWLLSGGNANTLMIWVVIALNFAGSRGSVRSREPGLISRFENLPRRS
jgi:O-antigen ligase